MATLGVKKCLCRRRLWLPEIFVFFCVTHEKRSYSDTNIILITGHFEEEEIVVFGLGYFLKLLETHHKN